MSSTGIIGSLNWAMQGEGGLYKTSVIGMRIAGWLNFIGSILVFLLAIITLIVGMVGMDFIAEAIGQSDECDDECVQEIKDGGALIAVFISLGIAFFGGIMMVLAKLQSIAARRMAQTCEGAKGWFMAFGIIYAILFLFDLLAFNFFGILIDGFFVAAFLIFPLLDPVKSQLTVTKAEAQALERGA